MDAEELKHRTKEFGLGCIRIANALPRSTTAEVLGRQLIRSATSVGANYRAACRAQSRRHFISKLAIVIEEADESVFWLEMMAEANLLPGEAMSDLKKEGEELTAILTASSITAKRNLSLQKRESRRP